MISERWISAHLRVSKVCFKIRPCLQVMNGVFRVCFRVPPSSPHLLFYLPEIKQNLLHNVSQSSVGKGAGPIEAVRHTCSFLSRRHIKTLPLLTGAVFWTQTNKACLFLTRLFIGNAAWSCGTDGRWNAAGDADRTDFTLTYVQINYFPSCCRFILDEIDEAFHTHTILRWGNICFCSATTKDVHPAVLIGTKNVRFHL